MTEKLKQSFGQVRQKRGDYVDARGSKKEVIASAAKELFSTYGFKAVSMDKIAEKSGVAKGTLYLYFKDKEELFHYLLEEFIEEIRDIFREITSKNLPLCDEIPEVVYRLLLYRKNQKFLFRVFKEAHEFKSQMARSGVRMIDNLVEHYIIDRLSAVKSIDTEKINIEGISFVIVKAYSALAFEWEEMHEPLNESQIAQTIGYLLQGSLCRCEQKERC